MNTKSASLSVGFAMIVMFASPWIVATETVPQSIIDREAPLPPGAQRFEEKAVLKCLDQKVFKVTGSVCLVLPVSGNAADGPKEAFCTGRNSQVRISSAHCAVGGVATSACGPVSGRGTCTVLSDG